MSRPFKLQNLTVLNDRQGWQCLWTTYVLRKHVGILVHWCDTVVRQTLDLGTMGIVIVGGFQHALPLTLEKPDVEDVMALCV